MRIVYPHPMHLSLGYSYMLSIAQFVNALAEYCPVDLLTLDSRGQLAQFYHDTLGQSIHPQLNPVQLSNRCCGLKSNQVFFARAVKQHVKRLLQQDQQIVIYGREYKQLWSAIQQLGNVENIRFVFEAHQILSQNLCRKGEFKQAQQLRQLETKVLSNVHAVVPITQTLAQEIGRIFPAHQRAELILPVGVSAPFFAYENGASGYQYDVIYAGNFSQWKGVDVLINALALLVQQGMDLRVLLVGANKHQYPHYQQLIEQAGLQDSLTLKAKVPLKQVPELLAQSRVGIVAVSYQEDGLLYTSPLKLYEYLASGITIVAARVPSVMGTIPEGMVHWATPDNAESYATAIQQALQAAPNPQAQREYAANYTWDKRAKRLVDFLYSSTTC